MTVTQDTKVTIGTAVLVLVSLLTVGWRLNTEFSKLRTDLTAVQNDSYSKAAAAEQALRLAMENPGLRVPDPRDPTKVFEVRSVIKTP